MITHDELHALMRARRSVRRFRPDAPPRAVVEALLASAVTAPSASNKQPWRFIVVESRPTIGAMADAVRAAIDRVAAAVEPAFEASFRADGDYVTRFEHAPLVIVPICRPLTVLSNLTGASLPEEVRGRILAMERESGLIGTALALQNLLLAAHAAGLGASGMTGPLVAADALRTLLAVPPSWHLVAVVPIGYPDEAPEATERKPVDQVTRWIE
jgi:nitroreductase